jgi:hypothetical protein
MASKPHTHLSRTELSDNETKKIGQFALQPPILHLCLVDRGKRKAGAQSIKHRCQNLSEPQRIKNLAWNENKNEIHIQTQREKERETYRNRNTKEIANKRALHEKGETLIPTTNNWQCKIRVQKHTKNKECLQLLYSQYPRTSSDAQRE